MATKTIKKIGNGAFLPLPAATLQELNLRVGDEVSVMTDNGRLVVHAMNDDYVKTRNAATRMVKRYRRTLFMLGREGDAE